MIHFLTRWGVPFQIRDIWRCMYGDPRVNILVKPIYSLGSWRRSWQYLQNIHTDKKDMELYAYDISQNWGNYIPF